MTGVRLLAQLGALRGLSIIDGPLAGLSPLAGLRLDRLFAYRANVTDLSSLVGTLQGQGLAGFPVRDLSVVTTLPAPHHVNLRGTRSLASPTSAPRSRK
ncbi:hypothetical protein [Streptomyces sp. NPDC056291]|uniref:hypothetical protein n=1 Tax=Streptomyces sp. NPDC056291 TaxID=3345772 RepID=UPI0035E3589B